MKPVFYNTLSRRREPFTPQNPHQVTMYVCGPTVYSAPHIGNARCAVVFDVLARLLRHLYPKLRYVRNITDVDDKIITAAQENNLPCHEITQHATQLYHQAMETLGVIPPDVEPRVTDNLEPIIAMITALLTRGHAYEIQNHVLFHVPSCPDYGHLSRRDPNSPETLARIENLPFKRHPADFVLWKPATTPQEPGWGSPWGRGRPGWHIECSAMVHHHLGNTIDIHGGGQDLIFPHHENEIAQSQCAHSHPNGVYSRFWLHNGMVTVEGNKMSKSAGNVILVNEVEGHPEAVRLALLSTHYRQTLDWTPDRLKEAERVLERLYGLWRDIRQDIEPPEAQETTHRPETAPCAEVVEALCEDLNTPGALTALHAQAVAMRRAPNKKEALGSLLASAHLLGVLREEPETWFGYEGDEEVARLVAQREDARRRGDFTQADHLREQLARRGLIIEDSSQGPRVRPARKNTDS